MTIITETPQTSDPAWIEALLAEGPPAEDDYSRAHEVLDFLDPAERALAEDMAAQDEELIEHWPEDEGFYSHDWDME